MLQLLQTLVSTSAVVLSSSCYQKVRLYSIKFNSKWGSWRFLRHGSKIRCVLLHVLHYLSDALISSCSSLDTYNKRLVLAISRCYLILVFLILVTLLLSYFPAATLGSFNTNIIADICMLPRANTINPPENPKRTNRIFLNCHPYHESDILAFEKIENYLGIN